MGKKPDTDTTTKKPDTDTTTKKPDTDTTTKPADTTTNPADTTTKVADTTTKHPDSKTILDFIKSAEKTNEEDKCKDFINGNKKCDEYCSGSVSFSISVVCVLVSVILSLHV